MANQHYVPQSVLKNFTYDKKKKKVFLIYKKNITLNNKGLKKIIFSRHISEVCSTENYLRTALRDFDTTFNQIDGDTPIVLGKILTGGVQTLDLCEKDKLFELVGYQYIRSLPSRDIAQGVIDNFVDPSISEKDKKELIKTVQGNLLSKVVNLKKFLQALKLDVVSRNVNEVDFVIGDCPVLYDATGYGIYMPISSDKCLWFHCNESTAPLTVSYINELQFLSAVNHVVASTELTLRNIVDNPVKVEEIEDLNDSYWKCILQTKNSGYCINKYMDLINENRINFLLD
jgi:hypothetical protein